MPTPTGTLATQRPDLQTFFQFNYAETLSWFIGQRVFPVMNVAQQAGTFGRVTLKSLLENSTSTARAPRSGYNRRQYEFDTDSYATEENGIEEVVDDREAMMYRNYLDAEFVAMRRAMVSILTAAERRVAAIVADATYYTAVGTRNVAVSAGQWTVATSKPVDDIEAAFKKAFNNTGVRPNALILNEATFRVLRNNQQVIDRINSAGAGTQSRARDVTIEQLQNVFAIDNVLVGGGIYNTANVNASPALAGIWPNHAMVCTIANTNDMMEPCIGRTIHWSEDGSLIDGYVESYRDEAVRGQVIRVRHETQEKALYRDLGVMIPSVIP